MNGSDKKFYVVAYHVPGSGQGLQFWTHGTGHAQHMPLAMAHEIAAREAAKNAGQTWIVLEALTWYEAAAVRRVDYR